MTPRRLVPVLVACVALAAVAWVLVGQTAGTRTDTGLVVDVDAASLTDVRAFTLRTSGGRETTYRVGVLENGTEFPPSHLSEHLATGQPVKVWYREADGERVAYRIEDAAG